jgi:hypothetical protein
MPTDRTMNAADMTRTSNEWMRRFIETPEEFAREFQSVTEFLTATAEGREPTYGERCTAYQFKLLAEMSTPTA